MRTLFQWSFLLFFLVGTWSCEVMSAEKSPNLSVINQLMEGNRRYQESNPIHPDQTKFRRESIAEKQNPKAIIISCSDSRVPPEIIFDQGLGDFFVIRTAGNVIGDLELASIEYALLKLNCNTIMVLGHEKCGAIQSFLDFPVDTLPGHLNELVNFIRCQPVQQKLIKTPGDKNYESVLNNVIYVVSLMKEKSQIIQKKFEDEELEIFGAIYHLDNGKVQIIEDEIRKKSQLTELKPNK